jgi:hypothetical protein
MSKALSFRTDSAHYGETFTWEEDTFYEQSGTPKSTEIHPKSIRQKRIETFAYRRLRYLPLRKICGSGGSSGASSSAQRTKALALSSKKAAPGLVSLATGFLG